MQILLHFDTWIFETNDVLTLNSLLREFGKTSRALVSLVFIKKIEHVRQNQEEKNHEENSIRQLVGIMALSQSIGECGPFLFISWNNFDQRLFPWFKY